MRWPDSTLCIDFANGVHSAKVKAEELEKRGEQLSIAAPALTEFLVGALSHGGRELAMDAARLGGECARCGEAVAAMDLLIAAEAHRNRTIVLT
jgi:predicted nucleic acid-binding protein